MATMESNIPEGPGTTSPGKVIKRGFGLKAQVLESLNQDYYSPIVEKIRLNGNHWEVGGLKLRLAEAFGFCYGVDKAIDFAYETRLKFPDRRIFLTNEIIHNPRVNRRMMEMGIRILTEPYADGTSLEDIHTEDIVLLPAFGVDEKLLERLKAIGCLLVDTTCGSVVIVWKRVERYARDGFTAMIHGKYSHEETIATCSHVTMFPGGQYIVLRNREEAAEICEFIRTGQGHGVAGRGRDVPGGDDRPLWQGGDQRAFPLLRYDLQRHAGTPGCGDGDDEEAAGPDAGGGGIQQFEHVTPQRDRLAFLPDLPCR